MSNSEVRELLNSSSASTDTALAALGFVVVFALIVCMFAVIFKVITRWVFFKKCGEEGWKSLIPFYTDYTLLKISGLNWWWILILYAGTILSSFQSSINVLEELDSSVSYGPIVGLISLLSLFASFAALFARINQDYNIAKRFNKSGGYVVLLILFEPIMLLILGLSKNEEYDKTIEVSPNGLFGVKPSKSIIYCPDCGTAVNEDYCPKCGKKVR